MTDQQGEQSDAVYNPVLENRLVRRMCPFAHSAYAIQSRHTECRGEVAVRPAARRALLNRPAQVSFRQILRRPKERDDRRRALHGGAVQASRHLQGAAFVEGFQRVELSVERLRVPQSRYTDVYFRARLGRHDIGARSAADDTRVHREPLLQICELRDANDLFRQFDNGARSRFKIDSSMRRFAMHVDCVVAHSLACRFQLAFRPRSGLEHQHRTGFPSQGFGLRTRARAPHFFITDHPQRHLARDGKFQLAKCLHRVQEEGEARLHVQHARSPQASLCPPERHRPERAQAPDRIRMADAQNAPRRLSPQLRQCKIEQQVTPVSARTLRELRSGQSSRPSHEQLLKTVHRRCVVARRFAFHHLSEQRDQFLAPSFHPCRNRIHGS